MRLSFLLELVAFYLCFTFVRVAVAVLCVLCRRYLFYVHFPFHSPLQFSMSSLLSACNFDVFRSRLMSSRRVHFHFIVCSPFLFFPSLLLRWDRECVPSAFTIVPVEASSVRFESLLPLFFYTIFGHISFVRLLVIHQFNDIKSAVIWGIMENIY